MDITVQSSLCPWKLIPAIKDAHIAYYINDTSDGDSLVVVRVLAMPETLGWSFSSKK